MSKQRIPQISIAGAGLAGTYLAVLLAKRGYKITVYERRSRRDTLKTSERSINISFHNYGKNALKKAGVWEEIRPGLVPLRGSVTKLPHYKPILASFKNMKLDYWSAKREKLLAALIKKADSYPNITFSFMTEVVSVDRTEHTMLLKNLKTKKLRTVTTDVVVAADGVNSTVRSYLQRGQHTEHNQIHSGWEYKQVPFSKEIVDALKFHTDRAYSSTRKEAIFVALPNVEGTFSGMLAVAPQNSFDKLTSDEERTAFIEKTFPELIPGLPELLPALKKYPKGNFVTMKTFPWRYKDFMVLVGDAGHSVTPFIGHGVTIGFGDCLTLVSMIDKYEGDFGKAFAGYQEERKKHVDILVDMSLESFGNFQRERKAHYSIVFAAFESLLHKTMPGFFSSSIFERIVYNPDQAYTYMTEHRKQRRMFRYMGVPLLVRATTLGILIGEKIVEVLTAPFTNRKHISQPHVAVR